MTNILRLSLGIAAAAFLIGCSKAETASADVANDSEVAAAEPTPNTAATSATPAAAPASASASDFMVGKWSAMGTCDQTLEFRKDGSVVTPIGGGKWSLTGDQLLIQLDGADKQPPSTLAKVDDKTIKLSRAGGKTETQIRC